MTTPHRPDRRRFLRGASVVGIAGLVGCIGDDDEDDPADDTDDAEPVDDADDPDDDADDTDDAAEDLDDVSMEIGSTFEPGHITVECAEMFAERMDEESDGRFDVTVTPGGAYGAEDEIAELVAGGTLEGLTGGMLPYMMYAEENYPLVSPFLAEDWDHHQRIVESDIIQEGAIPQLIEEGNQRVLGQEVYRGVRHFTSNEPIYEPADVAGLDLRLPEIDAWVEVWTEIGASPTPVALDEMYSAVQTGVVDSTEGDVEQISAFNLDEVQDYLTLTGHRVETGILSFNEDFYQGLDETYQEMMEEVAWEVTEEAAQIAVDREDDLVDELGEEMEIIDEPDLDRDAFFDEAEPALERLFEERFEADLEEVRAL
ncbi:TRAP transporter substrate-binding protein [Natronorarus salvus]|uniref:TRAP transporter substrate-binding protein n=1 Tax=Natronorarus salvus TaxID=3117733 RepID=UPI002F269BEE